MRLLGVLAGGLAVVAAAIVLFAPREPVDLAVTFDPAGIGADLDAYLAEREARFDDITPGVQKRIIWADAPGQGTEDVILYIHGFSATSEEIRPVPDMVASALGANLLFWRLTGHGQSGEALADATVADWIQDMAEALAVAARIGNRVTVIATSTGGTLAALAAAHPDLAPGIARLVFVSPNFRIASPLAPLLTWPGVRLWGPLVAGQEIGFQPVNEGQARYWTTRYPTVAAVPMAAMVAVARRTDFGAVTIPALFLFSDDDRVVSAAATREVAARWGGPATISVQVLAVGDDPFSHVIAGDILSPARSAPMAEEIVEWLAGL